MQKETENVHTDLILTDEDVSAAIARFEEKYGMSSDEFLRRWKAGEIPDNNPETMQWYVWLEWT